MAQICPRCGGLEVGCPVCDAPPKHERPENIGGLDTLLNLHYPLPEGIRISQVFGANPQWYTQSRGHNGIDWACMVGTEIYAMADGEVIRADATSGKAGYGRHVRIQHPEGVSIYGHLSMLKCTVGDRVVSGQVIGLSGGATTDPASGNTTGPHLHAEYRLDGVPNPVPGGYVYNAINILPLLVTATEWEVHGVDLSAWNGIMDFNILKTKVQYVVIRLGYGNGWKDSRCDAYRDQAIAADIPYFGYWFANIGQSIDAHANGFAEVAAERPGILGYEEDFERTYLSDKTETLNWIVGFDTKLKTLVNKKTSPYSSWNFWKNFVAPNNYFTEEQWVAHWTQGTAPYMPPGWTWQEGCKWQWEADGNGKATEYGMVSGGDPDIDLNRYYGTVDRFNTRYGTHILPIGGTIPPPPSTDFIMECIVDSLYVREGPGTAYRIVGGLHRGDEVALMNVGGSSAWMQIKSGINAGKWCAVQTSYRYMTPKQ